MSAEDSSVAGSHDFVVNSSEKAPVRAVVLN